MDFKSFVVEHSLMQRLFFPGELELRYNPPQSCTAVALRAAGV